MKERPILFSGPMVRAILEGRKTMTRRVVKPQPQDWYKPVKADAGNHMGWLCSAADLVNQGTDVPLPGDCPYGVEGDRLWVRETWTPIYVDSLPGHTIDKTHYRADETNLRAGKGLWKPSIHMPRDRSRITLEVTGVRAERLHEITEEDAVAEGIEQSRYQEEPQCEGWKDYLGDIVLMSARHSFETLWVKIYGRESWDANPWVWVVEFERMKEEGKA